jgi:hypothetical protein
MVIDVGKVVGVTEGRGVCIPDMWEDAPELMNQSEVLYGVMAALLKEVSSA